MGSFLEGGKCLHSNQSKVFSKQIKLTFVFLKNMIGVMLNFTERECLQFKVSNEVEAKFKGYLSFGSSNTSFGTFLLKMFNTLSRFSPLYLHQVNVHHISHLK